MRFKEKNGILRGVDSDKGLKVQVGKMGKIEWMQNGGGKAEKKRGKVRMNELGRNPVQGWGPSLYMVTG